MKFSATSSLSVVSVCHGCDGPCHSDVQPPGSGIVTFKVKRRCRVDGSPVEDRIHLLSPRHQRGPRQPVQRQNAGPPVDQQAFQDIRRQIGQPQEPADEGVGDALGGGDVP